MRYTSIILFLVFTISVTAQDASSFSLSELRNYSEIVDFEKAVSSEFKVSTYFNPHNDDRFSDLTLDVISQAYIFKRADNSFTPELATWYFLNEDSIVKGHFYNWGFYNPDFNPSKNQKLLESQKNRLEDYQQQYKEVRANLIDLIGKDYKEITVSKSKRKYYQYCIWDTPEFRTLLEVVFDPTLTEMAGFVVGGDSHVQIKTFMK